MGKAQRAHRDVWLVGTACGLCPPYWLCAALKAIAGGWGLWQRRHQGQAAE